MPRGCTMFQCEMCEQEAYVRMENRWLCRDHYGWWELLEPN